MKKTLLSMVLLAVGATSLFAQETPSITINDKSYEAEYLITREEGPGILYRRIRIPGYPLNVNIVEVDLTNPYNRVETMQAGETLCKTEKLETAAKRYTTDEKRVIAGANANFWCVSSQQPHSDLLIGVTYNGNSVSVIGEEVSGLLCQKSFFAASCAFCICFSSYCFYLFSLS